MLKNDIHDPVWFFDLEWVPDASGAIRLYDLPAETTEIEAMEHVWRTSSGFDPVTCPRPFVKHVLSRIVSIAFLSRRTVYRSGEKHIEFALNSLPKLPLADERPDEAYLISQFLHYVGVREPQLVGYNSLDADLQVILQRGIVNEVRADAFSVRPEKPWEGRDYFDVRNNEAHLDLLQRISRFNQRPKLNELAKLCGFPGKVDTDGAHVVDLWLEGRVTEIVEYNMMDALNTYLVWLRIVNFAGKLSEEDYISEQAELREYLEGLAASGSGYLGRFLEGWKEF